MDINKLKGKLQNLQRQGSGSNLFLKLSEEKQQIRMVPYPHQDGNDPFIEVYYHYDIAGVRSLICPNMNFGEPCPICDLAEEFRTMGGKENWRTFTTLQAKMRTYSPVIVRDASETTVKLWGYGSKIYTELLETFMDEDYGDLSNPNTGRDINVWFIPSGSPGNDSDYSQPKMKIKPAQSKLASNKETVIKLLESMPNYLHEADEFKAMSFDQLKELVRKLSDVEPVDTDTVVYTKTKESNDDDETDDDLNDKLKGLFEEDD